MAEKLEKLELREAPTGTSLVTGLVWGIVGELMKPTFCLYRSPPPSTTLPLWIPSSVPTTTALFCTNSRQQSQSTQYWNSLLYCIVYAI